MRNRLRALKAVGISLICVLTAVLSGCGSRQFNAASYVEAMLDASYKGDFKAYSKQEIGEKKDAQKMYEDNLDALVDAFSQIFGADMSKETKQALSEAMAALCKNVKYDVGEATPDGSHFNVDVLISPLKFSSVLQDSSFNEAAEEAVKKAIEENENISSDELMKVLTDLLVERFGEIAKNPEYADETSVTVVVEKDKEGNYGISNDSWDQLDKALIQ